MARRRLPARWRGAAKPAKTMPREFRSGEIMIGELKSVGGGDDRKERMPQGAEALFR